MARQVEEFEFTPSATETVVEWMGYLAEMHDGWVNLLPGVPEEEVDEPPRTAFTALFGTAEPPVSMCTWMPARQGHDRDGATVGIVHPKGRHAASQLSEAGVPVPPGWRVGQDHPRRGLIVRPPAGEPHARVLDWVLRAGTALAAVPLTGTWKATVYLPHHR